MFTVNPRIPNSYSSPSKLGNPWQVADKAPERREEERQREKAQTQVSKHCNFWYRSEFCLSST